MKKRANWLLISALLLTLGACQKKEKAPAPASTPETPAAAISRVPVAPEPAPVIPALTPDERAAKLGFVKYLPQDAETVISYYQGTQTTKRLKSSQLWKFIANEMGGEVDEDAPADPTDVPFGPAALFGTEFTFALGKSSSQNLGAVLTLNRRSSYFQMRSLVKSYALALQSGDATGIGESFTNQYGKEMINELLNDPKSGIELIEKLQMPPMYFAFKVKEADRDAAGQLLASSLGMVNMLGEMVEPATAEANGSTLSGVKILGSKISATLAAERDSMDESITPAMTDRLLAALAKNDIVLLSGSVGDYSVIFIGPSTNDFKLSANPAASICGSEALAFADAFASKDLAAMVYGEKASNETYVTAAGGISDYIDGLRDGIAASEGLGDTRDLDALFRILAERDVALRKLAGQEASGIVAFFEEGFKIESFGGYDGGMVDYKASNQLAHLGNGPDVALFANVSTDPVFQEKASDYFQAIFETASAISLKIAETPLKIEEIEPYREKAKLFDSQFRPDLLAFWGIYKNDFRANLGAETAWVVDLKGTAPKVPGASEALLAEAKVPRVSLISPVKDRAKLAESWTKVNATATATLAKVSKLMGTEIPMQEPLSSEKNGAITWFFALPFATNDFLPSVTLNDRWFIASSSKNQALDLLSQAETPGTTGQGLYISADLKALGKYADETLKLVETQAPELMGQPFNEEDLKILKGIRVTFSEVDSFKLHSRREGNLVRTSLHLKTR
jgi:hypothetical protein